MSQWATIGVYLLGLAASVTVNAVILSYLAGKHSRKVDELAEWRDQHDPKFNEVSREVSYLSGRMNGGTYKHQ